MSTILKHIDRFNLVTLDRAGAARPDPYYRVVEIFHSVQFEGTHYGSSRIFIRFHGCNIVCPWCDEPRHRVEKDYMELTPDDIMQIIWELSPTTKSVILTGGEPTAQDLSGLISALRDKNYEISIETNGILDPEWIDDVHWVTCSPKTRKINIRKVNEFKFIYEDGNSDLAVAGYIEQFDRVWAPQVYKHRCPIYIQPCEIAGDKRITRANLEGAIAVASTDRKFRLSIQVHKFLGLN